MKEVTVKIDMSDLDKRLIIRLENIENQLELILNRLNQNVLPPAIPIPDIPIPDIPIPAIPIPAIPDPIPTPSNYIYLEDFGSDLNKAWREAIQVEGKVLKLKDNKTYTIDEYETVEPKIIAVVGNLDQAKSPDLIIGSWTKEVPNTLFRFKKPDPKFAVVGINLLQPKGQDFKTAIQVKYLYDCELDLVKTAKLALIGSKVKDKDQLCWALCETVYSSGDSSIGFMDFIAKDVVYNGPVFQQMKTSRGNNIRSIWSGVTIHNPRDFYMDGEEKNYLPTHYYNPCSFESDAFVYEDKIKITSEKTFDWMKTHHGYEDPGVRCLVNVGRFVFNVYDNSVSEDGKTFYFKSVKSGQTIDFVKVSNYGPRNRAIASSHELQAGDVISHGKIIEKQINNSKVESYGVDNWPRWTYILDRDVKEESGNSIVISTTFNLFGIHKVAFGFKYNAMISSPFLKETTKFNEWQILFSGGMGWTIYDHIGVCLFWINVIIGGFIRQSQSEIPVVCLGHNLENVTFSDGLGEFKIQLPFSDKVILPSDIVEFIEYAEAL